MGSTTLRKFSFSFITSICSSHVSNSSICLNSYVKNEPMGNNGYDYNYAINEGPYANHHYNPYMHYGEPQHTYDHLASHHQHYAHHQNGPGPENHHHPVHYPQPQIPNPHMNQHHHPHHYGHGMDGGMSLNPPSHYNMMPSNPGRIKHFVVT